MYWLTKNMAKNTNVVAIDAALNRGFAKKREDDEADDEHPRATDTVAGVAGDEEAQDGQHDPPTGIVGRDRRRIIGRSRGDVSIGESHVRQVRAGRRVARCRWLGSVVS